MGLCSKLYFILSHHICNRKLTIRIPTGDSKQVNTVIKAIEFSQNKILRAIIDIKKSRRNVQKVLVNRPADIL